MIRSPGAEIGFAQRVARTASSRLIHAVAASLALCSLSLCLILAITLLSTRVIMATPLPL